jgi:hypothetical protein
VAWPTWRLFPCRTYRFRPSRTPNKILNHNKGVPCGGPWLGHMAPFHSPTKHVTCKPPIGPCQPLPCQLPNHLPSQLATSPIHISGMVIRSTATWHVRTVQSSFFPCLGKKTERDISLVRTPFELVQITLGS